VSTKDGDGSAVDTSVKNVSICFLDTSSSAGSVGSERAIGAEGTGFHMG